MSSLGLNIRIPKQSLIDLRSLLGKRVIIKYNGGRIVQGQLKSYDRTLNMVLNGAKQMKYNQFEQDDRQLGLIIVKGSQVYSVNSKDKYVMIENPFNTQEIQQSAQEIQA